MQDVRQLFRVVRQKFNLSLMYVCDPVTPSDGSKSAVVLRYADVWLTPKTDCTDSRQNDCVSGAERLERAIL